MIIPIYVYILEYYIRIYIYIYIYIETYRLGSMISIPILCFPKTLKQLHSPGSTLVSLASRDATASDQHGMGVKKCRRSASQKNGI